MSPEEKLTTTVKDWQYDMADAFYNEHQDTENW